MFPFGVSFARFEHAASDEPLPADISALPRPVVGYVGGLHQWVDQDLLAAVAARMPDVAFALVGPAQTDVSRLTRCPNVHLLGQRSHLQVPAYIKAFDVGLVPYKLAEYTANVYPTKLNEYLVMGKPVVATDLPEIRRFNAEHGDVVRIAGEAGAFEAAVRSALAERAPELVPRRIAVAQANSWQSRIAAMKVLIDAALDTRPRTIRDGTRRCGASIDAPADTPRRSCLAQPPCISSCSTPISRGGARSR